MAQFPRACDIIAKWQECGATCVIGGPHISGLMTSMFDGIVEPAHGPIPCPHIIPPDFQKLMDEGVVVFRGEAEPQSSAQHVWAECLADIIRGTQNPMYNGGHVALTDQPLPDYQKDYLRYFAGSLDTLDLGRGCPFLCTFCAAVRIEGHKMRGRDPLAIKEYVKEVCEKHGRIFLFIVDDNFSRHPRWKEILDGLIELRQQGYNIKFMIQADTNCNKIKDFIPKLAAAGCGQVFIGIESVNPLNLQEAGKKQNRVADYKNLCDEFHKNEIVAHAAYIIGFNHDTLASVASDVETLIALGFDQASFFILTPACGSEDHIRDFMARRPMDPDLNRYDTLHPVVDHPLMTKEEWLEAYQNAWRQFYRPSNMVAILKRFADKKTRWFHKANFLWYWWSIHAEKSHPMVAGWYRHRWLCDRRLGLPKLPLWKYCRMEAWRHVRYFGLFFAAFYIFQYVHFEVEYAPRLETERKRMQGRLNGVMDWFRRTFGKYATKQWLNEFWIAYGRNRWQLLNPLKWSWHIRMLPYATTEIVYTLRYLPQFLRLFKETT
jgi:hypothetical protein